MPANSCSLLLSFAALPSDQLGSPQLLALLFSNIVYEDLLPEDPLKLKKSQMIGAE
jgi:hypothetical protein